MTSSEEQWTTEKKFKNSSSILKLIEDASLKDNFFSNYHYYIVPDLCNECKGISLVPKCLNVCPLSGIIPDLEHWESEEHLYAKKEYLDTLNPWGKNYV